ncbi:MAG: putative Ig domain-containing protein, partial [Planctomycetota bacterium]
VEATGGIPFYDYVLEDGALPPGLVLDRFTGAIEGTPTAAGSFPFTLRVLDYSDGPGVTVDTQIVIGPGPCVADVDGSSVIDLDDVSAVINGWGPCPALPSTCPADVDGSGQVDVGDLVSVVLSWGMCR